MFRKSCFVVTLLFASSYCQTIAGLDDDLTKQLQGRIPEGFNASALPNEEQQKQFIESFHQKCLKNADEATYMAYQNSTGDLMKCVQALVDQEELKREMDKAKPTGDLDLVFKKYCGKTPQFKDCAYAFTDKMEACLSEKERANMLIVHNITDSLAEFICFKEGDRIALFISEGGPECFQSKQEQIKECFNRTMGSNINTTNISMDNIPDLVFEKEQCDKLGELQLCAVKVLEGCAEPTPSNIANALFNYVRQVTPCKEFEMPKSASDTSGAVKTSLTISSIILISGAFLLA